MDLDDLLRPSAVQADRGDLSCILHIHQTVIAVSIAVYALKRECLTVCLCRCSYRSNSCIVAKTWHVINMRATWKVSWQRAGSRVIRSASNLPSPFSHRSWITSPSSSSKLQRQFLAKHPVCMGEGSLAGCGECDFFPSVCNPTQVSAQLHCQRPAR